MKPFPKFSPYFFLLTLSFFPGCHREKVDPELLKQSAGKFAFDFYKQLNEGDYRNAVLFFSHSLRSRYPDPQTYPLIVAFQKGEIDQVFPEESRVDYRTGKVYIRVSYRKVYFPPQGAPVWTPVKTVEHEWVRVENTWYFNGEKTP
jgi:hypothetical protein